MNNHSLIAQLPKPPENKTGWPWTEKTDPSVFDIQKVYPKTSIVTPSYNQGHFIEETIRSVLLQNYPNLEFIIIDGGSTDNTVEIIKKYERWISYWVSEKDRGQSHAINKGIEKCSGDIIAWINSDDFYLENTFLEVAKAYIDNPNKLIVGNVINFDEIGKEELIVQKNLSFDNMISLKKYQAGHQPGMFFPHSIIKQVGLIDETLHYLFDMEWILRILRATNTIYLNKTVARFRLHNTSKTVSKWRDWQEEVALIRRKYVNTVAGVDANYVEAILLIGQTNSFDYHNESNIFKNLMNLSKAAYLSPKVMGTSYFKRSFVKACIPRKIIEFLKVIRFSITGY